MCFVVLYALLRLLFLCRFMGVVWHSLAAPLLSLVSRRRANFSFLPSHLEPRRTHRWLLGSKALIASPLLIGKVAAIQSGA
jgi:hypothetical protein